MGQFSVATIIISYILQESQTIFINIMLEIILKPRAKKTAKMRILLRI